MRLIRPEARLSDFSQQNTGRSAQQLFHNIHHTGMAIGDEILQQPQNDRAAKKQHADQHQDAGTPNEKEIQERYMQPIAQSPPTAWYQLGPRAKRRKGRVGYKSKARPSANAAISES
jgi:hypothetical protein